MNNVISFPIPDAPAPRRKRRTGTCTLFLHVRRTTLIVHLAAQAAPKADQRLGKTN